MKRLHFWADEADHDIVIGCTECPTYREILFNREDAFEAAKQHIAKAKHSQRYPALKDLKPE